MSSSDASEVSICTSLDNDIDTQTHFSVVPPILCCPLSSFDTFAAPEVVSEQSALDDLLVSRIALLVISGPGLTTLLQSEWAHRNPSATRYQHRILNLLDFSIYWNDKFHEFANLNELLGWRRENKCQYFDGTLHYGNVTRRVKAVPFAILSLDGYGSDDFSIAENTCIRSSWSPVNVWYKLIRPAPEYALFYRPFSWLANFTKHFCDYLMVNDIISISDFRQAFYDHLDARYAQDATFHAWLAQYNRTDFRVVVCAHIDFLWKEAIDLDQANRSHPLWSEIHPGQLDAIPEQPRLAIGTIVSPFVFRCFKDMYFADQLVPTAAVAPILEKRRARRQSAGFTALVDGQGPGLSISIYHLAINGSIRIGDVVAVDSDVGGAWKSSSRLWYGYVQAVDQGILKLLWLYSPVDTSLSDMHYPFGNELFLSDHCNCGALKPDRITESDVKFKLRFKLHGDPSVEVQTCCVRQCYLNESHSFVTLTTQRLKCKHISEKSGTWNSFTKNYPVGTCVLVRYPKHAYLEPAVVVSLTPRQSSGLVVVRRLRRQQEFDIAAQPHHLVYTSELTQLRQTEIVRPCHVKYYSIDDVRRGRIPTVYSHQGTADCYVLSSRLSEEGGQGILYPLDACPAGLIEGFGPKAQAIVPLSGLGIFAGGGALDRGLSDSEAVHFTHAVEWDKYAAHTIRANAEKAEDISVFLGSVNDYMKRAFSGEESRWIAAIGTILCIAAGSPCVAFSALQMDRNSERSHRNASLVASLLTYIEHYLPDYAVLENVIGMGTRLKNPQSTRLNSDGSPHQGDSTFSQLICGLVGLGYQVQQTIEDAWRHGSGQARSRLIIVITAPGKTTPSSPPQTHKDPPKIKSRGILKGTNGLYIGVRDLNQTTPFDFVTASETTKDLPVIANAVVKTCIPFPDHRVSVRNQFIETMLPWIPCWGSVRWNLLAESKLSTVRGQGYLPSAVENLFTQKHGNNQMMIAPESNALGRVKPDRLFPTITTAANPMDAKNGTFLHWEEQRMLTVHEARRAQSYPDNEVIIGGVSTQWKIIGNSVDRKVAVALGVSILKALIADATRTSPPSTFSYNTTTTTTTTTTTRIFETVSVTNTTTTTLAEVRHPLVGSTLSASGQSVSKAHSPLVIIPNHRVHERRRTKSYGKRSRRVIEDTDSIESDGYNDSTKRPASSPRLPAGSWNGQESRESDPSVRSTPDDTIRVRLRE